MSTKIEWTEETWNPVTGCTKVSPGCKHCYAERMWKRLSAKNMPYEGRVFTDVEMHLDRLVQPLTWKKPRRVFVNSMSDLFHESVSDEFIDSVIATIVHSKRHTFQILTKRPERMMAYMQHFSDMNGGPLSNAWLGVSVENQEAADERIPLLLKTPAAVRFLSVEPLLGPVDIVPYVGGRTVECQCGWHRTEMDLIGPVPGNEACMSCGSKAHTHPSIDWVIVGGESGPKARPVERDWVRSLRDQCQDTSTPFFFKQWGEFAPNWLVDNDDEEIKGSMWMDRMGKSTAGRLLDGVEWSEYPGLEK